MLTVPFENLDIPLGRRITLAPGALWAKVIVNRRGGFCYELNTLFGWLLQSLGYRVDFLSARVWTGSRWGPDKDHMALLVHLNSDAWLADVGFGDSFLVPLRLAADIVQDAGFTSFRLLNDDNAWIMQARRADGQWEHGYRFMLESHAPESFQEMCDFQQTSPDSNFTRRVVCSRATDRGRVTVTHDRLIVTADGVREETGLPDAAAFRAALATHLGISLTPEEAQTVVARFSHHPSDSGSRACSTVSTTTSREPTPDSSSDTRTGS
jgi:N-hydroxyarylamine O-acetyltransferase